MTNGANVIKFVYQGISGQVIQELNSSNVVIRSYAWDSSGRQLYVKSGSSVWYEITDPHGDVAALAAATSLAGTEHFDAWGNLLTSPGSTIPFGYQGSLRGRWCFRRLRRFNGSLGRTWFWDCIRFGSKRWLRSSCGGNLGSKRYSSWAVTLRPTLTFRWVGPLMFLAFAIGLSWSAYQSLMSQRSADAVFPGILAVGCLGVVVLSRSTYIRVDQSTIVFGPTLFGLKTFDRRQVAAIRATPSPTTRRTVFLRPDGSTLWSTAGFLWGRAGLQSLADYLGVPFEGADSISNRYM